MALQQKEHDKKRKNSRKSKMEILETIKDYIETEDLLFFNKSSMLEEPWNLDPRTVEEFLHIAYFCQNKFPRIKIQVKNGKKVFYQLDYQELKREIKNITLQPVKKIENAIDIINPKVFPVFKCRTCEIELGYPSHHGEPMKHLKSKGKLVCAFRDCKFSQTVPAHHHKNMEIYVKYTNITTDNSNDWLHEETDDF